MKNNDLISRSALIEEILRGTITTSDLYGMGVASGMDVAIERVRNAPAVDAVEVVRCKDCRHYYIEEEFEEYGCECCYGLTQPGPLDFCRYGDRRADDGKLD